MAAQINRRALTTGLVAVTAAPAVADVPANLRGCSLRGDDTARLPDHAAFWARLPLPFSLTDAWHMLSPATQVEIGAAVLGMALADYVSGDMHDEADHFHDDALRGDAMDVRDTLLNRISDRLWSLFPNLYGPDGDHPAWALDAGLAPPVSIA
ncbi:hypothetical protein [Methylobacterium radiotolerans]|uniref:hypothetical protein n=1 Tax=Methylobacterium radiotolerans TaxID=31998 RepID=UPI001F244701|nr:hypothetical protein [Methylobacterium radiotolerans]UIY45769.1 hypothetical protein LZ599_32250 [Methylobacterium radiotolerans]